MTTLEADGHTYSEDRPIWHDGKWNPKITTPPRQWPDYGWASTQEEFLPIIQNSELEQAIIIDIDGTTGYNKLDQDVIDLVKYLSKAYEIVFISWCIWDKLNWLATYFPDIGIEFYTRKEWDHRSDSLVKYEILQELIREYYILYVVNSNHNIEMWKQAEIRCRTI